MELNQVTVHVDLHSLDHHTRQHRQQKLLLRKGKIRTFFKRPHGDLDRRPYESRNKNNYWLGNFQHLFINKCTHCNSIYSNMIYTNFI